MFNVRFYVTLKLKYRESGCIIHNVVSLRPSAPDQTRGVQLARVVTLTNVTWLRVKIGENALTRAPAPRLGRAPSTELPQVRIVQCRVCVARVATATYPVGHRHYIATFTQLHL